LTVSFWKKKLSTSRAAEKLFIGKRGRSIGERTSGQKKIVHAARVKRACNATSARGRFIGRILSLKTGGKTVALAHDYYLEREDDVRTKTSIEKGKKS